MAEKSYLIDTSIILEDIENIYFLWQNGENNIFLCDVVLSELGRKKEYDNEVGYFAREFFRSLNTQDELTPNALKQIKSPNQNIKRGDTLYQILFKKDTLSIPLFIIHRKEYRTKGLDYGLNDARIAEIAKDYNFILLTNDIALKIFAFSQGIASQSLFRNRVDNPSAISFNATFRWHKDKNFSALGEDKDFQSLSNWSLIEIDEEDNTESSLYLTGKKYYGLKVDGEFEMLDFDSLLDECNPYIRPINLEQKFLYSLLIHPKNKITVCSGATGSGKTLIALQAGIYLVKKGLVEGIIYLRNTVTANDKEAELGYRKGDELQKLNYFMYPLYSAINFSISKLQKESIAKKIEYHGDVNSIYSKEATEYFIQKHNIEIMDIAHARGISIAKKFVIFDEAQNASNATIKLVGTRMGGESRIVFLGDPAQIDHPYLSKHRNGLVSLLKKAKNDNFLAGIQLKQTIRSEIAGWFEENFE